MTKNSNSPLHEGVLALIRSSLTDPGPAGSGAAAPGATREEILREPSGTTACPESTDTEPPRREAGDDHHTALDLIRSAPATAPEAASVESPSDDAEAMPTECEVHDAHLRLLGSDWPLFYALQPSLGVAGDDPYWDPTKLPDQQDMDNLWLLRGITGTALATGDAVFANLQLSHERRRSFALCLSVPMMMHLGTGAFACLGCFPMQAGEDVSQDLDATYEELVLLASSVLPRRLESPRERIEGFLAGPQYDVAHRIPMTAEAERKLSAARAALETLQSMMGLGLPRELLLYEYSGVILKLADAEFETWRLLLTDDQMADPVLGVGDRLEMSLAEYQTAVELSGIVGVASAHLMRSLFPPGFASEMLRRSSS